MRRFPMATVTIAAFASLAVGGCGGGGGGGGAPNPPVNNPPPPPSDPLGPVGSLAEEQDRLFESIGLNVIQPGYAALTVDITALESGAATYCSDPGASNVADLEEAWRSAMLAWQSIAIVRFGPVEESNRRLRIQFFPDPNDAVVNNVSQILNGSQTIDEALVAASPVGAQGLPALEYLIFDLGGLDDPVDGPRRCELAVAIGQNLATMGEELATAWSMSGQLLADFTSAGGTFTDRTDVLTEILESLAVESEFVADEKLTRPIQVGASAAESFRAEHSRENLIANVDTIRTLLDVGTADTAYGLRDYLARAHSADAISAQLDSQLSTAEEGLAALNASLEGIILGTDSGDIDSVRAAMQDLADSFIDAAIAADVNLGFNNQDGD